MTDAAMPPISETRDDDIYVRGRSLAGELLGQVTFTEMFLLDLDGELPSPQKVRLVDAVLVALMEHGITPSTLAARIVLDGAPDELQGAVGAGILATGSRFLGTVQQAAAFSQAIVARGGDLRAATFAEVAERRARREILPGVGHNLHAEVDPRVAILRDLALDGGLAGPHVEALEHVADAAAQHVGRRLVPNAAGAIGAILSDLGYSPWVARGFPVVARAAGLVAHLADEQRAPIGRQVWQEAHERFGS